MINAIIDGLNKQKYFKSLIIHENELDLLSVDKLTRLFSKKRPENLESLRISHCKMNSTITKELLDNIRKRCFLRKLELVKVNLDRNSRELVDVINQNKNI